MDIIKLYKNLQSFFSDVIYDIYLILFSPKNYFKEHFEDSNTISHKFLNIVIFSSIIILAISIYYGIKKDDVWNITSFITVIVKRIIILSLFGFVIYCILYPFKQKSNKVQVIQTVGMVLPVYSILIALIYYSFLSSETIEIYYFLWATCIFLLISLSKSLSAITGLSSVKIGLIILVLYILFTTSIVGINYLKSDDLNKSDWLHDTFQNPLSKELRESLINTKSIYTRISEHDPFKEWQNFWKEMLRMNNLALQSKKLSEFESIQRFNDDWLGKVRIDANVSERDIQRLTVLRFHSKHANDLKKTLIQSLKIRKELLENIIN